MIWDEMKYIDLLTFHINHMIHIITYMNILVKGLKLISIR